jgi:hypothetical protein
MAAYFVSSRSEIEARTTNCGSTAAAMPVTGGTRDKVAIPGGVAEYELFSEADNPDDKRAA